MKLLGWMHRKFRQNANDPFKDLSIGQPSLDELQHPPLSNYNNKHMIKAHKDSNYQHQKYPDEEDPEDETSADELSEIFHGFLAIGTLGTDPSSTPTFSFSVENIMEKETQVTEEEMKLINDELEKVLVSDEICNVSSGRNSHVSTGRNSHVSAARSSHCSTITLGGKPRESTENIEHGAIVCPLQSYLLGSAMGYQETNLASATKKEQRVSLGELFQKTEAEEICGSKLDMSGKKMEKGSDKSVAFLLKKLMKKKINSSTKNNNCEASGGTNDYVSSDTKFQKILQIFHRKVHPESPTAKKKSIKTRLGLKGDMGAGGRGYEHAGPQHFGPGENKRRQKSQSNAPQTAGTGSSSVGILPGEHWIKSDSNYLVLEL